MGRLIGILFLLSGWNVSFAVHFDLSSRNLNTETVSLEGDIDFYWNQLLDPTQKGENALTIPITQRWVFVDPV